MQFTTRWQRKYIAVGGWRLGRKRVGRQSGKRDRRRGRKTGREERREISEEEEEEEGKKKKRGVVSPCVQAGAAHWRGRRGRKREAGLVTMATLHYSWDSGGRSTAVLAFGLSSGSVNKEVVCIIRAYWLPRETEEEEPVLFGRLWFVVGWSN